MSELEFLPAGADGSVSFFFEADSRFFSLTISLVEEEPPNN